MHCIYVIKCHISSDNMLRVYQYVVLFLCIVNAAAAPKETVEEPSEGSPAEVETENTKVKPDESPKSENPKKHANGSVCSYCSYCKFCKLCDADCPCTKSKSKPNCHMCKYCKYCNLCSAICDTVCQPGGILDTVSSTIWNSLPTFDSKMKEKVDKDIDSVKDWIKEYL